MSEIQGRVKKLSIDKDTGEVYGFVLDGTQGYFNYSKPEYRDKEGPWDAHPVNSIVKVAFQTAENGKRYVSAIKRCDTKTQPPFGSPEGSPAHVAETEEKAAVVKEVLAGEQGRNQSIERQVAMKCAAEVVAAQLGRFGDPLESEELAALIDLCLDKFLAATK